MVCLQICISLPDLGRSYLGFFLLVLVFDVDSNLSLSNVSELI